MIESILKEVLPGVGWLAIYITGGILLGWLLEAAGAMQALARLAAPAIRRAALPPVCAVAFVTALASPKAAGGMLSAAHANGEISRRSLVLGAAANSFLGGLTHLRVAGPLLIVTLGAAGTAYVAFTIASSVATLAFVLLLARRWPDPVPAGRPVPEAATTAAAATPAPPTPAGWRTAWERWRRLLPKALLVAIPVYTLVAVLDETGVFAALSKKLPPQLAAVLPAEAMAVIVTQMANTSRAVPVAKGFLDSGALSTATVFFALVAGYVISLPMRVVRRNLPGALALYPGRNGMWVILLSQAPRFLLGLALVIVWLLLQRGRFA